MGEIKEILILIKLSHFNRISLHNMLFAQIFSYVCQTSYSTFMIFLRTKDSEYILTNLSYHTLLEFYVPLASTPQHVGGEHS